MRLSSYRNIFHIWFINVIILVFFLLVSSIQKLSIVVILCFIQEFLGAVSTLLRIHDLRLVILIRLTCIQAFETRSVFIHGFLISRYLHVKMDALKTVSHLILAVQVQVPLALRYYTAQVAAGRTACLLVLEWLQSWFGHIVHSFLEMRKYSGVFIVIILKVWFICIKFRLKRNRSIFHNRKVSYNLLISIFQASS